MTREEAIKILSNRDMHGMPCGYTNGYTEALDMAIEALKAPEWIPAIEKPETEEKTYLIQTDYGYVCICRWTNVNHFWTDLTTDWHWHIMDIPQYHKVVAWMPLPEPYKAESEDKE